MVARKTTEQFIEEARAKHGDRYDYSKTVYQTCNDKITVIDTTTGEEFSILPGIHLQYSGRPQGVKGKLSRTCSLCSKMMTTPSKSDLSGFIEHGEKEHPGYFIGSAPHFAWIEKKYYNPINDTWYGSRKYLARSITQLGWTNEQFYLTYGEQWMSEEWSANTNDPKFGDAPNTPTCLETGEPVKFDSGHWCYPVFKDLSASTTWHAKNTDRVAQAEETKKIKSAADPNYMLQPTQIDYWVVRHGLTRDEAIEKVRERQTTNSLDAFIKRANGDVEAGKKAWASRQEKWLKSLEDRGWFGNSSMISKDLFSKLSIYFENLRYGDDELNIRLGNKVVKPDCIREQDRKVIEFYGDYWHANPLKFEADDAVRRKDVGGHILAKEIWNKDRARISLMEQHGYEVLVVWEHDYKKSPDDVLLRCIEHLQ